MIVLDLEMTGLNAQENSIISLGAIDFDNPERTLYLECRPRQGSVWEEEAYLVHGLSQDYLSKLSLTEKELLGQFHVWAASTNTLVIMGQNVWKDIEFLQKGYEDYDLTWPFGHRIVDLHSVALTHLLAHGKKIPIKGKLTDFNLDKIAAYCGLPIREGNHNALVDAKLTGECFSRLWHNKSLFSEFAEHPLPDFSQ